jgi:amino acid adenylation domain-containing protein
MPTTPSFAHVLVERAQSYPDSVALSYLSEPSGSLSYGDLALRASGLAARLRSVAEPGDRAMILLPPGLDYVVAFLGCLHAGVIAVPTYPPLRKRQVPRLVSVVADAAPRVVLTLAGLVDLTRDSLAEHGITAPMTWLPVDEGHDVERIDGTPGARGDDVAFLQYTSGSTGRPKGTIVTHANLLDNSEAIRRLFGHTRDSRGVIWLPPYHDMGLIGGILQPIYAAFPVMLMSPLTFLADPRAWLAAVSEHAATTSGGPNFAFDLCVRKIQPEQREGLDLSSWSVAFCGAEPVRKDTADRFVAAFGPHGFSASAMYPCYGLAESTLIAAGGIKGAGIRSLAIERGTVVSCGSPIPGHRIEVLAPGDAVPVADGEIGELCVRGPSVVRGYWNNPAATEETFPIGADGMRTLRTGDLGFLRDGELYVTGRLKDLVIVRGRNLAAEDIEHALVGCHPAIGPGGVAAFEVDLPDDSGLAVLAELREEADTRAVTACVQQALVATFGVRAERVLLGRRGIIPKTQSGKIRRGECRRRYLDGELRLVADGSTTSERGAADQIADLASGVLELPTVGTEVALTAVGLDSLRAVELWQAARNTLGIELSLEALLAGASAAELAGMATATPDPIADHADAGDADEGISDGERGLWLASRLSGDPGHYVLAIALDLSGPVDATVLDRTLRMLVARHPALRTYFPDVAGVPQRKPVPDELTLRVVDVGEVDEAALDRVVQSYATEDINPATGPLWRVTFIRRQPGPGGVLVLCAHHMACDVWSLDVLAREFSEGYDLLARGQEPNWAPAGVPARIAGRANRTLTGARGRELAGFWGSALDPLPPSAALPQARPRRRAVAQTARYRIRMPATVVDGVHALVRETGVTPYTVLQTAFAWLLHRYTGDRRFVLGMPAPGRLDPESISAVGYFVNPLPLICEIDPAGDFRSHLRSFGDRAAAAQAHQDYPYQRILENCVPPHRGADLIRILLLQQQAPSDHALSLLADAAGGVGDGAAASGRLGGLAARTRFVIQRTAPFELTVEIVATADGLTCSLIYDVEALDRADIEAFASHWARLLDRVTAAPSLRPGDVEIMGQRERDRLLDEWNATTSHVDGPTSVHESVLDVCARTPDAVAVRDTDGELTFAELDRRSARLAVALTGRGVTDERPVALLLPRSRDLVVAMLATLRAASPYLPLDTEHPEPRLTAILDDAQPRVVVTTAALADTSPMLRGRDVIVVDRFGGTAELPPVPRSTHPDQLAHLIYTSGSTGTPKGVACGHRGVLNLVADYHARVPVGPGDRCGWWTSPGVDVSVHEVFTALTAGATVEVCPPPARHDARRLMEWVADRGITSAYLPPHLLPDIADWLAHNDAPTTLRWLLVGVEPIPEPLLRRIGKLVPGLTVINGYGPTETTVWATFHTVEPASTQDGITPLGRSVSNCPIYLLDRDLHPVPIGAVGEIYIGGNGVARGYRNRPGLTAERFVPSPFATGGRLYRTGDLASYRRDGNLVFLGRADHQAKVRGMRVEPREIETAMVEHPAVSAAIVLTEGAAPETRLIGYARVAVDQVGDQMLANDIARHLRARLPGPMVPGNVVLVGEWPMTINGKIDRARLPRPEPVDSVGIAPVGDVEATIAEVFARLLERPAIGRTDNFFELGGHSLLAIRASAELAQRLSVAVEPCHVMDHPNVAELGAALEPQREGSAPAEIDVGRALLQHVAALPPEAYEHLTGGPDGDGS